MQISTISVYKCIRKFIWTVLWRLAILTGQVIVYFARYTLRSSNNIYILEGEWQKNPYKVVMKKVFLKYRNDQNLEGQKFPKLEYHSKVTMQITSTLKDEKLHRWRTLPSLLHEFKCRQDKRHSIARFQMLRSQDHFWLCALSTWDDRTQLMVGIMQDFQRHCYQLLRFNKMVSKYWLNIQ